MITKQPQSTFWQLAKQHCCSPVLVNKSLAFPGHFFLNAHVFGYNASQAYPHEKPRSLPPSCFGISSNGVFPVSFRSFQSGIEIQLQPPLIHIWENDLLLYGYNFNEMKKKNQKLYGIDNSFMMQYHCDLIHF